jgi:hypothetical protein
VEDNPSSLSLFDVYRNWCGGDQKREMAPVDRYYDKLARLQVDGGQFTNQNLKEVLLEIQRDLVPKGLLKKWAMSTYPNATSYWTFRQTVRQPKCRLLLTFDYRFILIITLFLAPPFPAKAMIYYQRF